MERDCVVHIQSDREYELAKKKLIKFLIDEENDNEWEAGMFRLKAELCERIAREYRKLALSQTSS